MGFFFLLPPIIASFSSSSVGLDITVKDTEDTSLPVLGRGHILICKLHNKATQCVLHCSCTHNFFNPFHLVYHLFWLPVETAALIAKQGVPERNRQVHITEKTICPAQQEVFRVWKGLYDHPTRFSYLLCRMLVCLSWTPFQNGQDRHLKCACKKRSSPLKQWLSLSKQTF